MKVKGIARIMLVAAVLLSSTFAYSTITKSLIDFPVFDENMDKVVELDAQIYSNKMDTFKAKDPSFDPLTHYGYQPTKFEKADWHLSNWTVILASSANTVRNNVMSYCKPVASRALKDKGSGNVLGARIHFPEWRFLSWALVKPPYEFFVYYDDGRYVNRKDTTVERKAVADSEQVEDNTLSMGVLVNVGQIKRITAWVYGLNYQHQIGLRLTDRDDRIQEYYMGATYYDGWRPLSWKNPNYTDDIRDRLLQKVPLYPKSYPYVKFDSFVVYKPDVDLGGDFIVYFREVKIEYDRAIIREALDIDDEEAWNILAEETLDKKMRELRTISESKYLRQQEVRRMEAQSKPAGQ